jgi:hypothetical protein
MACTFLYQTKLQLTVEFAKLIIILLSGSTSKYISVLGALRAAPRAIKLKIRTIYSRASRPHSPLKQFPSNWSSTFFVCCQ